MVGPLVLSYICLTVYHIADSVCDWICWYHFKDSNPVRGNILTATCLGGTIFKSWFLYRLLNTLCKVLPPDIGKINVSRVLLPELNFSVLEGMVNLVQAGLGGNIISSKFGTRSCLDAMNFKFACCCCWGAVMQFACFSKNLCGYHGKGDIYYCQHVKVVNIVGFLLSLISALIGVGSIAYAQELQSCRYSWNR